MISDDKSDIDSKSDDLFLIHFEFNVKWNNVMSVQYTRSFVRIQQTCNLKI